MADAAVHPCLPCIPVIGVWFLFVKNLEILLR